MATYINGRQILNTSIALIKLMISGTPDGTKFLRDDGVWATPSGGGGGGSISGYSFTVDFGANWEPIARTTVSNASLTPTSKVIAFLSSIGSGRSQDELEMQTIECYCVPGAGSMSVTAKAQEMAWGQYDFNYIIL